MEKFNVVIKQTNMGNYNVVENKETLQLKTRITTFLRNTKT